MATSTARYFYGHYTGLRRRYTRVVERPGISPALVTKLLDSTVFLTLEDLGFELPDYTEYPVVLPMISANGQGPDQAEVYDDIHHRLRKAALQHTRLRLGEGHAGCAVLERRIISIPNIAEADDGLKRSVLLPDEGFIAYYGVPLIAKGQVQGVLEVFRRTPLDPEPEWLDFLETLAGQIAIAIDNVTLFNDLQRSNVELTLAYDTTLEGCAKALELRDAETEGHSRSVTEMTVRMARAMGMSDAELVHVRRGALLHDIGKMGMPDSILQKPGPLTDEEWEIMHQYPVYAYELLSRIAHLRPALDIPYCHHEKWDGSGYPRGIAGEEIPLAARIFAVVDVWDALTSERPYRPAWPEEKAVEYIRDQAEKHFDPQVVEMFLKLEMGMTEQANELAKE